MSTRRTQTALGEASFDHGAQYFTARTPDFAAQVAAWRASGLAAPWPAAGPDAWVGTPAMNAPIRDLARSLPVTWSARADRLDGADGWTLQGDGTPDGTFDTVLLAVPAENAAPLLDPWDPAAAALARATPAAPCWTVMAAFDGPVPSATDVLRESGPIGWAARNSAKPGRSGPESWVIQASPDWSRTHLEHTPEAVQASLMTVFEAQIGARLPVAIALSAHRWRYARSGAAGQPCLWNPARRIGVCGDWLIGPRVEAAWLSGRALAAAVARAHGGDRDRG